MAYNAADPFFSKLFCSINETTSKFYDITSQNAAPTVSFTPSSPVSVPGEWYYTNFTTGGSSYLCVVGAGCGYMHYDSSAGWVQVTQGTGAGQVSFPAGDISSLADLCFVMQYKRRLWFLKRNSTNAYYLPVNQIAGALQLFDFGPLLERGSSIAYLADWTYDSGSGVDDSLVAISFEGDMLIYDGTDPSDATDFKLRGVWSIGRSPYGRRSYGKHGGDVLIVTDYGILTVADLVAGRLHTSAMVGTLGYKINSRLSGMVSFDLNSPYWFLQAHPTEEILILGSPHVSDLQAILQSFTMESITNGWSTVSNMDMLCGEVFQGKYLYGSRTGDVIQGFVGFNDAVSADNSDPGTEVTGRIQGAFSDFRDGTKNKRLLRCKVYGQTDGLPSFYLTFRPEYELNELVSTPAPSTVSIPTWDTAIWDSSVWSLGKLSLHKWFGVSCFGKKLSLQMAIRSSGNTLLTDFEVLFESGIGL